MTTHDAMRRTLDRSPLPPGFERWRLTLAPGEERSTEAAEWAGALVVVERGRLEVECLEGGHERFERGDLLSLGWLPLRRLRNSGSETVSLLAVRRAGGSPTSPFLHVQRARMVRALDEGDETPTAAKQNRGA